MFDSKNILITVAAVAVIGIFGYILLLMFEPSPYAEMVASHAHMDNERAASHVLMSIEFAPKCVKSDVSRDSIVKYYKGQECFMLDTEIQKHRRPTRAELLSHGNQLMAPLSSRLKTCMSPQKEQMLVARIESGKNMTLFLDEIDRSRDLPGKLKRVRRKMNCGS